MARIKEIFGIDVSRHNFGIKKEVLKEVVLEKELKKFIEIKEKIQSIEQAAISDGRRYPNWSEIRPLKSELRGYRKYWRTKYTDGFSHGLYRCTGQLRWQVGKVFGEFGTSWKNFNITSTDLFMYVRHDKLGNVELMNTRSSEIVKLPRGNAACDKFIKTGENQ